MFRLLTVQGGFAHVDMRFNFEKCYKYKDSGYGYADLVSKKTGEIWEVKRLSLSKKAAKRQLAQYVSGKVKKDSYKIDTLHVGGEMGSKIDPQVIIRESGNTIYCIAYFDAGDGIIYYDYIAQEKKTAEEVLDGIAKAILIAGLLGLLIETGGAALPAIPAILELAW